MIYYYFIYFIIYAFIGWIYESTFRTIKRKKIVNSGFLNGPLIPIYGFGAVLVVFLFYDDNLSLIPLFLSSLVVTTILEYLTSYFMEKIFHARWWDYSDDPFNVNGRVFLLGSLVFGTFSVIVIKYIHPKVIDFVNSFNPNVIYTFSIVIFIITLFDFLYTSINILSLNKKIKELEKNVQIYAKKDKFSAYDLREYLKYKIASDLDYSDKIKTLTDKHKFQVNRLLKSFPKLYFPNNLHIWEALKDKFNEKN